MSSDEESPESLSSSDEESPRPATNGHKTVVTTTTTTTADDDEELPNCFPFNTGCWQNHSETLLKLYTAFSYISQFLTEISLIPVVITLIIGSGFIFAELYVPAAALWVAAYSLWVGHPLSILLAALPPALALRTFSAFFFFFFAFIYFVSLVLLIVGASLYIGPAAGVDGTKDAGSVLYIIGSAFYILAFSIRQIGVYYELVHIREKAEIKRLKKKERRVREVRKWGDGWVASVGIALGIVLLIGSVGISGWGGRFGEIMGGVLWIIAAVLLAVQMLAGILAIRPKGRMEVEKERKRERRIVRTTEETQQLSPKLERMQDMDDV
eukprot:TRINITY_DN883_c0_g1_i1.p1 TRINITY_DN883_c0_g1~~TRINITY_DN883_c0_g1_i1.p1  ORF type:complete len:325 (+),score=107.66 TRINITY_DN883_c0_g1_i1:364-1338(+)